MPNHIQCRLTAPMAVLDSLKSDNPEGSVVDFNTVIPMAEELHVTARSDAELAAEKALGVPARETGVPFIQALHEENLRRSGGPLDLDDEGWEYFIQMIQNKRKYGHYHWYPWSIENWGTKWNAYSTVRISTSIVLFQTAWSAPLPVIKALSEKFPNDELQLEWSDEDFGSNLGIVRFKNGVISELQFDTWDLVQDLWCLSDEDMKEFRDGSV